MSEEKDSFEMTNHFLNTGSCVKSGDWEIYSVKRLSDSIIFTVKDVVEHIGDVSKNKFTLEKFELVNSKVKLIGTNLEFGVETFEIPLNMAKHSKQKLFTTNDNVDIFEEDVFVYVDLTNYRIYTTSKANKDWIPNVSFSRKENADLYVLENKPCLSLNDFTKNMEKSTMIKNLYFIDKSKLETLIKTKL